MPFYWCQSLRLGDFFSTLLHLVDTEVGGGMSRVALDDELSTVNVSFLSSLRVYQEIQEKEGLLANQYVISLFWMNIDSQVRAPVRIKHNSDGVRG